jgi:uncharacterized protein (TIGR02679 family)
VRSAEKSLLFAEHEWFREWVQAVARDGTLTKLVNSGEQPRIGQAVRVLEFLAAHGKGGGEAGGAPVLLPELAAAVTGDTKALNPGTALSTLVLRALAQRSLALGAGSARFDTAEARRELWDFSDVVVDDLASRILVLNLPASGDGLGEWLTGAARRGVPFYVTLQQIVSMPVRVGATVVHVCENPAVLRRAASDLGASSAALVCTEVWRSPARCWRGTARGRGGSARRTTGRRCGTTPSPWRARPSRRHGIRRSARSWCRRGGWCTRNPSPTP